MSEHRRGVDEADVVRALQRAGTADTGVDVAALIAGARGRARTVRRRRQGVAGVVAVLALAVPVGISQWPAPVPRTVTPASPTATSAVTSIPDGTLLTTEQVTAVVDGLTPTATNPSTNSGLCQVDAYDGTATVVDSRSLGWGGASDVVSRPVPASAQLDVLLFRGDSAGQWMAATAQDAQDCTADAPESAPWTLTDTPVETADEVVAGFVQQTLSQSNPTWNASVVARRGQLVVRVAITTYQPTGEAAVAQAADLVATQLTRAADLAQAGGAAR